MQLDVTLSGSTQDKTIQYNNNLHSFKIVLGIINSQEII